MKKISGKCNICGNAALFFYEDSLLWRETLYCSICKSPSRYRSIAMGLINAVDNLVKIKVDSVNDFCNKEYT